MNEFQMLPPVLINVSPITKEGLVGTLGDTNSWLPVAWPAANRCILFPFWLTDLAVFQQIWVFNGGVLSGNLDVGVYTFDGRLLVHTGAKGQAGVWRPQAFPISLQLHAGGYWVAMAVDNTTAQYVRRQPSQAAIQRAEGSAQVATNFPLAESITTAAVATNYLPMMGLSTRSFL